MRIVSVQYPIRQPKQMVIISLYRDGAAHAVTTAIACAVPLAGLSAFVGGIELCIGRVNKCCSNWQQSIWGYATHPCRRLR